MLAVPLPWPGRARPRPAPAVAAPTAEIVVVELTRPEPDAFRVRVRWEALDSGAAAEIYVFYGARVEEIAERLLGDWERRGMRPTSRLGDANCRVFDFAAGFGIVAWAVELLSRRYAP